MGTHPIFESDFDCLTEIQDRMNKIIVITMALLVLSATAGRKEDDEKDNTGLIVGGLLGLVALPLALPAMGFTAAGVGAGTLAAGIQSAVYGGATAGVFSAAQSAAAAKAAAVAAGAAAGAAYDEHK